MGKDDPEYYPFRWKFADTVEDLFVLHRRKLIAATLLLLGAVAVGVFLMNDDNEVDTAGNGNGTSTTIPDAVDTTDTLSETTSTTAPETTTTTSAPDTTTTSAPETTTSTTAATTTTNASNRPVPTPEEIEAAQPGAIIEMTPEAIRLVGGVPSDAVANDTMRVVEQVFRGAEVLDAQVVDESFPTPDSLVFRLSAADLFGYNSFELNPTYLPVIDQLATAINDVDFWTVQVVGHTDDVGPPTGNQRLSERRAQAGADRLIAQGVSADRLTVVGAGEDEPIADNGTEAGRLANRRIEFVVSEPNDA